ncbi:hypothetical protein SBDP1_50043 [Syntrophobacter sp. SbD1]|nr:hypothetical protein SBDP1_50043 [Syntrophobacter sp. SbD1]
MDACGCICGRKKEGEETGDKDDENRRQIPNPEPEYGKRRPSQGRYWSQELDERVADPVNGSTASEEYSQGNSYQNRQIKSHRNSI